MTTDKVCILVVSHNYKTLTDSLCADIVSHTKGVDYDLHVIETGSDLDNCSSYMTLWVKEKCRMTRGFNLLRTYADFIAAQKGYEYTAYQLFVNDAKFIDDKDLVSTLYNELKANLDCGQIHPYQSNIQHPFLRLNKCNPEGCRKESFTEIICPMIRAEAWRMLPNLLDSIFFYGWGLDYDMPFQLHTMGFKTFLSDSVGIFHTPFTSYKNQHITKETLQSDQFNALARANMNEGFVKKYGPNWKQILYDGIPFDVSKECLYLWLHHQDGFDPS